MSHRKDQANAVWEAHIAKHPERVISDSSKRPYRPTTRKTTQHASDKGVEASSKGRGALDGKIDPLHIDGRVGFDVATVMRAIQSHIPARIAVPKFRSKLEARFAGYLETLLHCGEILSWYYEPVKLRLGPRTWYTPDFATIPFPGIPGNLLLYEVKGYMWSRDSVRLKVAREIYPIPILLAKWEKNEWVIT